MFFETTTVTTTAISETHLPHSPLEVAAEFVLFVGILLIVAKLGGEFFQRFLKLPAVLGHLTVGIAISPYALGGLSLFGIGPVFPVVPFDIESASGVLATVELPTNIEIYVLAQLAAVVLLFDAGLETNRTNFIKRFKPATLVALGGIIFPFAFGFFGTLLFGFASLDSLSGAIPALFVGTAMTATSIGITARVLSDIGKLDSPEGVTVLGAAVVDDILGVLILSFLLALHESGSVSVLELLSITGKALGFLAIIGVIAVFVANRLSKVVLGFRAAGGWLGIAFSLAFITAGVSEIVFGLAMIIGSYSLGLAMSNTNLAKKIAPDVSKVSHFLSPLFFVVIGMQVNFQALFGGDQSIWVVLSFAAVISLFGVISKLFGSGVPALFTNFNLIGASRIGVAMMPRGEVALIVAGIGLSAQIIDQTLFGIVIVMTVVTTVIAPVILPYMFSVGGSGLKENPPALPKSEG